MPTHPAGSFKAIVQRSFYGESGDKKTPYIGVQFNTDNGFITGYFYLSDKAAEYTRDKLQACGWDGNSIGELAENEALLEGGEVTIVVTHEDYNGEVRHKVASVYGGDRESIPMPSEIARRFDLAGGGKGSPKPAAPVPKVDEAYDSDDDVPF